METDLNTLTTLGNIQSESLFIKPLHELIPWIVCEADNMTAQPGERKNNPGHTAGN